ncbi:TPA: hypothetical protein N0F65_005773 [Lagenidium giganteum]|uniref:Aspartyl/asparaginy/proline hydroxylase domain-containing protein n=1 Tax=Lagenidium giganteum TaxID=4803 RepID=A0AAV2YS02_9STRA|nr:TPA: hypothetical protein N0F65_005773 [Lagenidium giganteum]
MEDQDQKVEKKLKELVRSWGLSRFSEEMAWQWLQRVFSRGDDKQDVERLTKWILVQLNQQSPAQYASSPWQVGCPEVIPLLRARAVWDTACFPWVAELERAFSVIKAELLALKNAKGFQPYRAPTWASDLNAKDGLGSVGHDAGDWNVFYLYLHNVDFAANRALCPQTSALISSIADNYEHAFFSALAPSTHIRQHHGPTNKKLRCHLPLVVPEGRCRLRAGDEVITMEEGKCFIFDDSFEHEAWNDDPNHSRIVLIVDVWHPDLHAQEKKFWNFLRNAQLRMDKKQSQDTKDNFYSIIQEASQANMSVREAIWS